MDKMPKGSLISFMANLVKSQGGINLAQGIPAFEPPKELITALKQVSEENTHQYAPGTGNVELLSLLCEYYKSYQIKTNNLLVTNGATESISLIFIYLRKLLNGSFTALAFDPVYESYKHLPRIFNIPFIHQNLNSKLSIDFNKLKSNIIKHNVKVIFIASPGNPLGKIWSQEEYQKLITLANEHELYLIWDAVYAELYFDKKPFQPLKNLSPRLFYVNAFSKQLSITGWRVGYTIMHESHYSTLLDIHDYIGLCAPSVLQHALSKYLKNNDLGINYSQELRSKLQYNYHLLANALKKIGFSVLDAQGGYFVWCRLPEGFTDGFSFAIKLYEKEKIACVPGIHFSENGKSYVRFNIAQKPEVLIDSINKIEQFIQNKL